MSEPIDTSLPSHAAGKTVFLLGATGYIGGTVLTKLLELPSPPSAITILVRDPKKAEIVSQIPTPAGTTLAPLLGSLSDLDKLQKAAATHDIVISAADADDLPSIQALIAGMKERRKKTGHRSLFIHTSGTGVLTDDARGQYPNDIIYTDLNPTPATHKTPELRSFETIPDTALHRNVDLEILKADAEGALKSYIIVPSTIWGEGKGEVFTRGLSNSFSQQMPNMIKNSLDRGRAGMVGKGANIWPHVSIDDLKELYGLVYAGALRGDIGHGKSGFYLGIAGEYTLFAAASTVGAALVENGWAKEAQPTPYTEEEIKKYYNGIYYAGSNSRGVADRSKSIGWKPKNDELEDFVESLRSEVKRVEKHFGRKRGEVKGDLYVS